MNARLHRFEAELLEAVSTGKPLAQVMAQTVRGIQALIPDSVASIHLLSADGLRLQPGAAPDLPASYVHALVDLPIGPTVGSCGTAAFRASAVVVADIATDPLWADYSSLALSHGLAACWSTPVTDSDGRVRATFAIYHRKPHQPQPSELGLTAGAARILGIAIDKAGREEAMRTSDSRLRNLFDSAGIGMSIIDLEGRFIEVNPAYGRMLGYTPQELQGKTALSVTYPEDWPPSTDHRATITRGEHQHLIAEKRFLAKDGRVVLGRGSLSAWRNDQGEMAGVIAVVEDITQQRQAALQLAYKSEQLAIASRLGRVGAWQYSLADQRTTWSDEICAMHDLPPGHVPTVEESLTYYAPVHRRRIRALFGACATGGVPVDTEAELTTAGGRSVWVRVLAEAIRDPAGEIERIQGALQDITAQKELEGRERALADRLAMTLETISDAFFTTSHDWRFTFGNRQLEAMFQLRRKDFLGKTMAEIFPADVGGPFDPHFRAALRDKKPGRVEAFHSGLGLWLDVSAFPTDDGMAVYLRDISARKQAEAEVRELNARLEARVHQRTEALTDANQALESFSYSVSHDLRAPLRTMSGFANLLEKEFGNVLPEHGRRYVQRIHASADKMGRLIDDLLLFSRQGRVALKPATADMRALAQEALDAAAADYPGHCVQTQLDALPSALCDGNLMRQVWVNLIGNAFKFTAKTESASVHVGCNVQDGEPVYFVRDNGSGFDMAYVSKLFGVFERLHTEGEFEGTGVGLAIVHQIITRHGGRVWAQGQVDHGATFFFTLGAAD